MKQEIKLSIIVPIYNAEKYINRCMESIYAQTFSEYEIILVNDGSKDRSAELCRYYSEKDERVKFINKENGGAGSARNAGIAVAVGEYVAFPDVDDWFEPQMYEELYQLAKSGNYDVVLSGVNYYTQTKEGEVTYSRSDYCQTFNFETQRECRENIMKLFPTTTIFDVPWNKIYKRSLLVENNIKFTNLRRCQDAVFNLDFYNYVKKVATTENAYYNYMENTAEDVARKFPPNYIDINIYYCTHLIELLSEWGQYKDDVKVHYDTTFVLGVYSTIGMYDNPKWEFSRKQKVEYVANIMNRDEIQKFLLNAEVRADAQTEYEILKNKDVYRFMLLQKKEEVKKQLRKNKVLIESYRKVKGLLQR